MESLALAEDGIDQEIYVMDSLRVHAKNGRINSDSLLNKLLRDLLLYLCI